MTLTFVLLFTGRLHVSHLTDHISGTQTVYLDVEERKLLHTTIIKDY